MPLIFFWRYGDASTRIRSTRDWKKDEKYSLARCAQSGTNQATPNRSGITLTILGTDSLHAQEV
jgi:hypothetical protein